MSQNIIQSNFIGKFKTGDNINLNFFILEAVIWDFIWRIQHFTVEGVAGINSKTLADIKRKKITDFRKCLEQIS